MEFWSTLRPMAMPTMDWTCRHPMAHRPSKSRRFVTMVSLTNLLVSAVEASENENDGFELGSIVNGILVDVTANGNANDGLDLSTPNGPSSIQKSTFCNNGQDIDGSQFSAFSHQSITCTSQGIGIDDICDCTCPPL